MWSTSDRAVAPQAPRPRQARAIFAFELRYQLRQPAFWVAALAFVAFGVLAAGTRVGELEDAPGRLARNVPLAVVLNQAMISALGMFAAAVFVGGAALRDFATRSEGLVFSRPVSTFDYVIGRLAGGVAMTFCSMACGVGAMALATLAQQGRSDALEPLRLLPYLFGWFVILVPNVLVLSALVFALAVWTRRLSTTLLGVLAFAVCQDIAEVLPVSRVGELLPALLDPLGLAAIEGATRYWTVADHADGLPSLAGALALNRLLWMAMAALATFVAARTFRRAGGEPRRRRKERASAPVAAPQVVSLPARLRSGAVLRGPRVGLRQAARIARFEIARILHGPTFWVVFLSGLGLVSFALTRREAVLDIPNLPIARTILAAVARGAFVPLMTLVVLYSGEVVWRERSTRAGEVLDALPHPTWTLVGGKSAALATLVGATSMAYALVGWIPMVAAGTLDDQWPTYLAGALLQSLDSVLFVALAVFVQVLAGGRLVGLLLVGLLLAGRMLLRAQGYTDPLYLYCGGPPPLFSDMDGYGHRLAPFLWGKAYWAATAALLLATAGLLWPRGGARGLREGLRVARGRWRAPLSRVFVLSLLGVLALGAHRIHQTRGVHGGLDRDERMARTARYELEYRRLLDSPEPRVTRMRADVDLHPSQRGIDIRGEYELHNPGTEVLADVYIELDPSLDVRQLELAGARSSSVDAELGMYGFRFDPPLAPGAPSSLRFTLRLESRGFRVHPTDRWVRRNGTFLMGGTGRHPFFRGAMLFPSLGYDRTRELTEVADRRRFGLAPWPGLARPDDPEAASRGGSGSEHVELELVVSTEPDQTVVAPGRLVETWETLDRRFFRFATERPMRAFFPIVSGRFATSRATTSNGTEIEVLHHPAHERNVPRILAATERSLTHLERILGPYPDASLCLAEIPGFGAFACSFPGVMAFAEPMAFVAPEREAPDLDPVLWVVAHEVAHQWWNHQVAAAEAQGSTFVGESLAQYGALRVIEEEYGVEAGLNLAQHYREQYLQARARSGRGERPLVNVEDQDFVHYAKGYVALRALARRAGVELVDAALASIVARHANREASFVTSIEVLEVLREHLPEELHPLLSDLFERIVFLDTGIVSARARGLDDGRWALSVEVRAHKFQADEDGAQEELALADEIQLAVHGENQESELLTLLQPTLRAASTTLETVLTVRPARVRLNPDLLYIDRNPADDERVVDLE